MALQNKKLVKNINELADICASFRAQKKTIIMTNGCFDIIHSGHTYLLGEAKKLGDILIVALNTDNSINKIKTSDRPIMSELDRAYVLSCLESVDYVLLFHEETPEKIICEILPDILVKGDDYKGKKIAGEECLVKNGKKVTLLSIIEGKSTTSIINKILKS